MEKLLEKAKSRADQAEVYYERNSGDDLSVVDSNLRNATSSINSGITLRVIKDGKIGFAYTRNLLDIDKFVNQALVSAENGMNASFEFPYTPEVKELKTFDSDIDQTDKDKIMSENESIIASVKKQTDGQLDITNYFGQGETKIMNSKGTNLSSTYSYYGLYMNMSFPGTASSVRESISHKSYQQIPMDKVDQLVKLYQIADNQIVPITGKKKVIFTHQALYALLSRFSSGTNPINFYNKTSPLLHRMNTQIFSPKITIKQNPFDDTRPSARAFDDEGTPCQELTLVDKGFLKNIYTNLDYAEKLSLPATGNGFKPDLEFQPAAISNFLMIEPGNMSLEDMISNSDDAIILYDLLGAHSGNVLNGDYSVGVSTGFYIENGQMTGRVKDCMIAGNIYETLMHVIDVENITHDYGNQKLPSILFDNVSVSGK